jgi:FxsC-like protein
MAARQPLASAPGGAGHEDLKTADVLFVVAAATRDRIAQEYRRRKRAYYGKNFREWTPYWRREPDYDSSIVNDARDVALGVIGRARSIADCALNAATVDLVDGAAARNQIVVFLVEPWSTPMPEYNETLLNLDRRRFPTSTVIVPWSDADVETKNGKRPSSWHAATFELRIRERDLGNRNVIYDALDTPEIFRKELRLYIEKVFDGITNAKADRRERSAGFQKVPDPDPATKPRGELGE